VISTAGELGMATITLGRLYFVLPYRFDPTDVAFVQYGRPPAVGPQAIGPGHNFIISGLRSHLGQAP
jgi:hypothetical protein